MFLKGVLMKEKIYTPKPGETFKMISSKIKENLTFSSKPIESSRLKKIQAGKFKNSELKYWVRGLHFLDYAIDTSLSSALSKLSISDKELTSAQMKALTSINLLKGPLGSTIGLIRRQLDEKYELEQKKFFLHESTNIIQSSRDGVITKKMIHYETRSQW